MNSALNKIEWLFENEFGYVPGPDFSANKDKKDNYDENGRMRIAAIGRFRESVAPLLKEFKEKKQTWKNKQTKAELMFEAILGYWLDTSHNENQLSDLLTSSFELPKSRRVEILGRQYDKHGHKRPLDETLKRQALRGFDELIEACIFVHVKGAHGYKSLFSFSPYVLSEYRAKNKLIESFGKSRQHQKMIKAVLPVCHQGYLEKVKELIISNPEAYPFDSKAYNNNKQEGRKIRETKKDWKVDYIQLSGGSLEKLSPLVFKLYTPLPISVPVPVPSLYSSLKKDLSETDFVSQLLIQKLGILNTRLTMLFVEGHQIEDAPTVKAWNEVHAAFLKEEHERFRQDDLERAERIKNAKIWRQQSTTNKKVMDEVNFNKNHIETSRGLVNIATGLVVRPASEEFIARKQQEVFKPAPDPEPRPEEQKINIFKMRDEWAQQQALRKRRRIIENLKT